MGSTMIELIEFQETDRWTIYDWRNSQAVSQFMFTSDPIPKDTHDRWFSSMMTDPRRRGWTIAMDATKVGAAFLSDIDFINSRASWAFYLADEQTRGKGIGSAVEYLVLEHVFNDLELHKLTCQVLSLNPAVRAMHMQFGFLDEGTLREHYFRNGSWIDVHLLAMFRSAWIDSRVRHLARLKRRGLVM